MKRNEQGSVILVLLALLLIGGIGFGIWRYFDSKNNNESSVSQTVNSSGPTNLQDDNLTTYTNTAAGFSFSYPKDWGKVEIRNLDSPSKGDTYLYAIFSNNSNVTFGGEREDYENDGRGLVPTDYPGYVIKNGKYYTYTSFAMQGELSEIEGTVKEIKSVNTKGLYQSNVRFSDEGEVVFTYNILRFNLKKPPYFGVNFVLDVDKASKAEQSAFVDIANTFKLI